MNHEYQLRPAQTNDSEELARLAQIAMPGYPFESVYQPQQISTALRAGEHRIVALGDQQIIATAVLGSDHMSEIKRVIVSPQYRRNGLAKTMTKHLAETAHSLGKISWADVRADQIGMQKAALAAGLSALSVEAGKHVVYQHPESGPARESMVHMTSLNLDRKLLYSQLKQWPIEWLTTLVSNFTTSLQPNPYQIETASRILPNASQVKNQIESHLSQLNDSIHISQLDQDLSIVETGLTRMLVIKPDASCFLLTPTNTEELTQLAQVAQHIGAQTLTSYSDLDDYSQMDTFHHVGLAPNMIRTWQQTSSDTPTWQVGWRLNLNQYHHCLHTIHLHPHVQEQLNQIICRI